MTEQEAIEVVERLDVYFRACHCIVRIRHNGFGVLSIDDTSGHVELIEDYDITSDEP